MDTALGKTRFSKLWGQSKSRLDVDDSSSLAPPPPPPKDQFYANSSRSATSLIAPSTPGSASNSRFLSSPSNSQTHLPLSKSKFKLPKLGKRPSTPSVHSLLPDGGDADITTPYNFSHDLHVDEGLEGLPVQWANTLAKAGYSHHEIHAMYARQTRPSPSVVPRPRTDSLNSKQPSNSAHSDILDSSSSSTHASSFLPRRKPPPELNPSNLHCVEPASPPPAYPEPSGAHFTHTSTRGLPSTPDQHVSPKRPMRSSSSRETSTSPPARVKDKRQSGFHVGNLSIRREKSGEFHLAIRREKSGSDLHQGLNGDSNIVRHAKSAVDLRRSSVSRHEQEDEEEEEEDQLMPLRTPRTADLPPRISLTLDRDAPSPSGSSDAKHRASVFGNSIFDFGLDDWGSDLLGVISTDTNSKGKAPASSPVPTITTTKVASDPFESSPSKPLDPPSAHSSTSDLSASDISFSYAYLYEDEGHEPPKLQPNSSSSRPTLQLPAVSQRGSSPLPSPTSGHSTATLTPTSGTLSFTPSPSVSPAPSEPNSPTESHNHPPGSSGSRHDTLFSLMSPISPLDPDNPVTTRTPFGPLASPPVLSTGPATAPLNIASRKKPFETNSNNTSPKTPAKATIVRSASVAKRTSAAFAVVTGPSGSGRSTPTTIPPATTDGKSAVQINGAGRTESPTTPRAASPLTNPSTFGRTAGLKGLSSASPTSANRRKPVSLLISEESSDDDDDGKGLLPYLRSPAPDAQAFEQKKESAKPPTTIEGNKRSSGRHRPADIKTSGPQMTRQVRPISTFTPTLISDDEEDESVQTHDDEEEEEEEGEGVDVGDVLDWYDVADGDESGEVRSPRSAMLVKLTTPASATMQKPPSLQTLGLSPPPRPRVTDSEDEEDPSPAVQPLHPSLLALSQHIRITMDPRNRAKKFADFTLIAEGESGSCVYSARVGSALCEDTGNLVAIKVIQPDNESGKTRLETLKREVELMRGVEHENVLTLDAVWVVDADAFPLNEEETVGGSWLVWMEMELMERSLADVLALVQEGLKIQEYQIARFAKDILEGLDYLQRLHIAHRDVRSDNLLVSRTGVLKISDFSNATLTTPAYPKRDSVANQPPYWMAPEMRQGLKYDPHQADIWSVGATIWEVVEGDPPFITIEDPSQFGESLPSLSNPAMYSQNLHGFLARCSDVASKRPKASDLLKTTFVRGACQPQEIVKLMKNVRVMEQDVKKRYSESSDRTA